MKKDTQRPTDAELEILAVIWDKNAATVREVHDVISAEKPTAYTTTLKLLQIMTEKGYVERDEAARAHIYRAKLKQKEAQQTFVSNLLDKVFGGSAKQLVLQALESKPASAEDMKEIRKILKHAEKDVEKESGKGKESKKKDKRK